MKKSLPLENKETYIRVTDVRVDDTDGRVYVKGKLPNDTYYGGIFNNIADNKQKTIPPQKLAYKVIKYSAESEAGVQVKHNEAIMMGGPEYAFVTNKNFGNFVVGPVTFSALPDKIRIGGIFTLNPLLMSMVPSTIVTPMPTLVLDIPGVGYLKGLKNILTNLSGALI